MEHNGSHFKRITMNFSAYFVFVTCVVAFFKELISTTPANYSVGNVTLSKQFQWIEYHFKFTLISLYQDYCFFFRRIL